MTLASVNNLAMLYQARGRYGEAEPLLRRDLAVRPVRSQLLRLAAGGAGICGAGFIDADLARNVDAPKRSPEAIVKVTLEALARGERQAPSGLSGVFSEPRQH